ncbi:MULTISPECIES: hypothetical protein [Sphingobacterium]|uniref:hypothetical protein n=1 Tax=Sphingobacterium TaxID=28453 RepID=UPI00257E9934|nr:MULTISPECIES: hypothetical protein [Sphingobacterium]
METKFVVVFKENESWFKEPMEVDELTPAEGWDVKEFDSYEAAQEFIQSLN